MQDRQVDPPWVDCETDGLQARSTGAGFRQDLFGLFLAFHISLDPKAHLSNGRRNEDQRCGAYRADVVPRDVDGVEERKDRFIAHERLHFGPKRHLALKQIGGGVEVDVANARRVLTKSAPIRVRKGIVHRDLEHFSSKLT